MADFQTAVTLVLKHEGGYSNDPQDPGKETNFGIASAYHPNVDIKNLTRQDAIDIYQATYWNPLYSKIQNQGLANSLLDCAVNQGPATAVRLLQSTLNEFLSGPIAMDGKCGPETVEACNSVQDQEALAKRFVEHRLRSYAKDSDWPNAHNAWINRSLDY